MRQLNRAKLKFLIAALAWVFISLSLACRTFPGPDVSFLQSSEIVGAYDVVEITAKVSVRHVPNCFTDANLAGWFQSGDGKRWDVEGFCDSEKGDVFRIRFMPPRPGEYNYFIQYVQDGRSRKHSGTFRVVDNHRKGPIRVDPQYPWHFIWEGTGEHYFFNGTTAYWLAGWKDERVIENAITRLHRYKINRIRVTVAGRSNLFYGEPVMALDNWTLFLTPWPAKQANDIFHPGFDYSRFDVGYWQKFDRLIRYARDNNIVISLVLDMNDGRVHPRQFSPDEFRFIRYAVARFSAFSNITWDLGDDLDGYRGSVWTRVMGTFIKNWDPYHHLATSHPLNNAHQDRTASWFDFTSLQEWSRNQHTFMLAQREEQKKLGRIIPQTNEEYGYEDHYPIWGPGPGSETADVLRRMAWQISMAGTYQTTGESARRGTNVWPDTGGGWMNGRGDDTMTMLEGYKHMVEFFTSYPWWKTDPHDELVTSGNYCLAKPGEIYAVYLPHGGIVKVNLETGIYSAKLFNPSTGEQTQLPDARGPVWSSPVTPDQNDWAILLDRKRQ